MLNRTVNLCAPAALLTLLDALLVWRHKIHWTTQMWLLIAITLAGVGWPLFAAMTGVLRDPATPASRVVLRHGTETILVWCLNALFIGLGVVLLQRETSRW